jgi:hypothetical protein
MAGILNGLSPAASSAAQGAPDTHNYSPHSVRRPIPLPETLPAGLKVHCAACQVVVPSDAPATAAGDCAFVALHKLAWFHPYETPAAQHVMAVAAWSLIYNEALAKRTDAPSSDYMAAFRANRKAHFAASAVRQAMTPEQVEAGKQHKRDGALYR